MEYEEIIRAAQPAAVVGSVVESAGQLAAVADFPAPVGALVEIQHESGDAVRAEVVGFRDRVTMVSPFRGMSGVRRGQRVRLCRSKQSLRVGPGLLGRVVNAHGETIDGRPRPILGARASYEGDATSPMERPRITEPLPTGVRAIDTMLTCGRGQRLGIFAGSGVGKSTLLAMMAKGTAADVIVLGLVGERGREVNEFIERDLGPEGLARSVVVVATSNEPAVLRARAASTATAIAEYFRDQGKDVLLMIDSVTRVALACRELGLGAGEPPTTRGYPPSVFSVLPRLVERAGRTQRGSVTAFYSVLVEGDDPNEPIADTMRGLLDGHVWLSRKIAERGAFPAIDPLDSLSRLMPEVAGAAHIEAAATVRRLLSALRENEDMISIGAYRRGSDPVVDAGIELRGAIETLLRQRVEERSDTETADKALLALGEKAAAMIQQPMGAATKAAQESVPTLRAAG